MKKVSSPSRSHGGTDAPQTASPQQSAPQSDPAMAAQESEGNAALSQAMPEEEAPEAPEMIEAAEREVGPPAPPTAPESEGPEVPDLPAVAGFVGEAAPAMQGVHTSAGTLGATGDAMLGEGERMAQRATEIREQAEGLADEWGGIDRGEMAVHEELVRIATEAGEVEQLAAESAPSAQAVSSAGADMVATNLAAQQRSTSAASTADPESMGWVEQVEGVRPTYGSDLPVKAEAAKAQAGPRASFDERLTALKSALEAAAVAVEENQQTREAELDDRSSQDNEAQSWLDGMAAAGPAMAAAIQKWQLNATLTEGSVNGIFLVTTPGSLEGPTLMECGLDKAIQAEGVPADVAKRIAQGLSDCWQTWQSSFMIPGMPMYPAFATFPGPQAPPMPNVPMPAIVGGASAFKGAAGFLGASAGDVPQAVEKAWQQFQGQMSARMLMWASSAQMMSILGKGPVPTFAPPYVPVGPVVGGDIIPGNPFLTAPTGTFSMPMLDVLGAYSDFVDLSSDAWAATSAFATEAWDSTSDFASDAWEVGSDAVMDAGEAVGDFASDAWGTLDSGVSSARSSVQSALDSVASAISSFFSGW